MNIEEILKRIKRTGGNINEPIEDYMFSCLSLSKEEYDEIDNSIGIEVFCKQHDISFITIKYNKTINFIHYSDVDNEEDIKRLGLINVDSDWVPDLGLGIYVIEEKDIDALDNLMDYFGEKDDEEELLKVTGTYTGPYEECIYGEGHEGYILIPHDVKPDNIDTEIICFEEIFY